MKSVYMIYGIIGIQLLLDLFMWFIALKNAYGYQEYWAILLALNVILLSLVMLVILRFFIQRSEIHG